MLISKFESQLYMYAYTVIHHSYCVAVPEMNLTCQLARGQTTKSASTPRALSLCWLLKQTRIAVARTEPGVMNNRDSLRGPFCSLFFLVSRPVPDAEREATDFNPAWICRGTESTQARAFRQYIYNPRLSRMAMRSPHAGQLIPVSLSLFV